MNKVEERAEEEEEEQSFEELGVDPRLIRALTKKSILKPTPIQRVAIPLILVSLLLLQYLHFHIFTILLILLALFFFL